MISKIFGRNFKDLAFDEEIGPYTLFVGPNGSGKSARSHALTLAILGYLPSDQQKQPSAIFATHGNGDDMQVAFETDDAERFGRRYRLSKSGTVSHEVQLNGKKLSQKEAERAIVALGDPKIFDLRSFNEISDTKKIELLLKLWPPSGDPARLDREGAKVDERLNTLRSDIRAAEKVVERLTAERASLELPAGTLAEVQAEIAEKEKDLEEAQKQLGDAIAAEREREAEEKAQEAAEELEETKQREQEALETSQKAQEELDALKKENGGRRFHLPEEVTQIEKATQGQDDNLTLTLQKITGDCLASLEKVKATLEKTGCEFCAGLIVVRGEIRKFKNS
jgi:chromosome segregation ATPase